MSKEKDIKKIMKLLKTVDPEKAADALLILFRSISPTPREWWLDVGEGEAYCITSTRQDQWVKVREVLDE